VIKKYNESKYAKVSRNAAVRYNTDDYTKYMVSSEIQTLTACKYVALHSHSTPYLCVSIWHYCNRTKNVIGFSITR